jgi:hypothetical protein
VSHPERACATGRTLHVISEREEHSSWIGKTLRIFFVPHYRPKFGIKVITKLPNSEHAFCLVKSPLPSPMEYGWRTVKDSWLCC